jgi:Domain of unknown function (DUF5615)
MRFLANENVPGAAVAALDAAGHDIAWVRLAARILLTFDKDFGELARTVPLASGCGVVLLRIPMPKSADVGRRLAEIIGSRDDWAGHFSVIEPGRVRMRQLESPPRS